VDIYTVQPIFPLTMAGLTPWTCHALRRRRQTITSLTDEIATLKAEIVTVKAELKATQEQTRIPFEELQAGMQFWEELSHWQIDLSRRELSTMKHRKLLAERRAERVADKEALLKLKVLRRTTQIRQRMTSWKKTKQ
jgi:hypothetical protein